MLIKYKKKLEGILGNECQTGIFSKRYMDNISFACLLVLFFSNNYSYTHGLYRVSHNEQQLNHLNHKTHNSIET